MQFSMYCRVSGCTETENDSVFRFELIHFRLVSSYTDKRISKDKLVNSDLFHTVNNSGKSV